MLDKGLRTWAPLVVALALGAATVRAADGPSITALSGIPGSADMLFAYHMSADGESVVGEAPPTDGVHAEGVVARRDHKGGWSVRAVGLGSFGDPAVDMPYQWDPSGSMIALGLYPGDLVGAARASHWGPNDPYRHALRRPAGGEAPELIDPAGDAPVESQAIAVNRNGRVIAGFAVSVRSVGHPYDPANDSRGHEGILWLRGDDGSFRRLWLGFLNDLPHQSRAGDISERGDRVVGFSGTLGTSHPVVWTWNAKDGYWIRDLGLLEGFEAGGATAISGDGRVIVGDCYRGSGDTFFAEAFVWDERHGVRSLREALLAAGLGEAAGWDFVDATGVSRDGTWISGDGTDPDGNFTGWVVHLPREGRGEK